MELGNLLFGNSRGAFKFPDRRLANSSEWEALCKKAKISIFYGDPEVSRDFYGFDNEVFTVRPYCWDDDEERQNCPTLYIDLQDLKLNGTNMRLEIHI